MGHYAKLTSTGQNTIPAKIRADLGVGPGDRVEYVKLPDGQIVVRKAKKRTGIPAGLHQAGSADKHR